jgi:putative transposase
MKFILAEKDNYPLRLLCKVMQVSRSAFYAWQRRPPSQRLQRNSALGVQVAEIHRKSRGTYGRPRLLAELRACGLVCGHERLRRLMKLHGLAGKQKRRFKATTTSTHSLPIAKNILARDFAPGAANRAWAADITYICTDEGWLYLAAVLDLYSRRLVGWAMDSRISSQLVTNALEMAARQRRPQVGLLHHSDRGSQYASADCQRLLSQYGMICSMSNKGNCLDNAVMESFFHTLKVELVHHRRYRTRSEAQAEIFEYIEVFYNRQRRHSFLNYATPAEYEMRTGSLN